MLTLKVIFHVCMKVKTENVRIARLSIIHPQFWQFLRILDPQPKYTMRIKKRILQEFFLTLSGSKEILRRTFCSSAVGCVNNTMRAHFDQTRTLYYRSIE